MAGVGLWEKGLRGPRNLPSPPRCSQGKDPEGRVAGHLEEPQGGTRAQSPTGFALPESKP